MAPWLQLLHPFPSLVVASTGLAFALLATPDSLSSADVVRLLALFLTSQFAIGAFNDYCDAELDATARPQKPIPAGRVPRLGALAVASLCAAATLAIGASLGANTLIFTMLATSAGLLYDFPFKRTSWSWLPYVVGIPLLPLWAWSAVGALPVASAWAYPIGALLALALHLANALPDDTGDRASGSRGLVQVIGRQRSGALLLASFGAALMLAVATVISVNAAVPGAMVVLGGTVGAVGAIRAVKWTDLRGSFELLAVGSGLLGIGSAMGLVS